MPENCAAIIIAAKHHELTKVKDTRGTTNTIGALRCKFDFRTNDWVNAAKTAMFCNGDALLHPEVADNAIAVPLDVDNECAVPYEVLTDTSPYSIGVWGVTDKGFRIVSKWLVFNAQLGCYTEGSAPEEPETTVYEKILMNSQNAIVKVEEIYEKVNSGELDGASAYELAKNNGFEGTEQEWLASLKGKDGIIGKDGLTPYIAQNGNWYIGDTDTGVKASGIDGKDGINGKSAYELACDIGFKGTEAEWIKSLDGKDGHTPVKGVDYFDGAKGEDGYTPVKGVDYFDGYTPVKDVDYFDGKDGISATHSWDGTILTITSASGTSSANLKGESGKDGYTPIKGVDYFDGTNGADGKDGYTPQKNIDYFDGENGEDGVSCTHEWNGTVLTVTSASGTSSVNLKGADGATPVRGIDYWTEDDKTEIIEDTEEAVVEDYAIRETIFIDLDGYCYSDEGIVYSILNLDRTEDGLIDILKYNFILKTSYSLVPLSVSYANGSACMCFAGFWYEDDTVQNTLYKCIGMINVCTSEEDAINFYYGSMAGSYLGEFEGELFIDIYDLTRDIAGEYLIQSDYEKLSVDKEALLGDVETALDHIIAIQNTLIGGDGE